MSFILQPFRLDLLELVSSTVMSSLLNCLLIAFISDVAIFACAFAYISDITSVKDRMLRITILDVVYLSTMPTGIALGKKETQSAILRVLKKSILKSLLIL